jgi:transposase InsO family protein
VSDTAEFVIGDGAKLYLAAILDLFYRFVVGWAISAVNDRRVTLKALEMAVQRRCPDPGLLHHSDRGSTYTCEDYQTYLATRAISCSTNRRGDCWNNAVMANFFAKRTVFRATAMRRRRCSITSRCSTTNGVVIDAGPDQSGRVRATGSSGVTMTVARSVAFTSQRLTTTGTPPSTRRLSSTTG